MPFGAYTGKVLRRYVQHFRPYLVAKGEEALFLNQFGERLAIEAIKLPFERLRERSDMIVCTPTCYGIQRRRVC